MFPSGFSMKFRKHINQKRLTNVQQVGTDRIIDLQFGDEERSCHVIVELYDRGNVVLTDHNYIILNVLRPRTDTDHDVRFSVKEKLVLRSDFQLFLFFKISTRNCQKRYVSSIAREYFVVFGECKNWRCS